MIGDKEYWACTTDFLLVDREAEHSDFASAQRACEEALASGKAKYACVMVETVVGEDGDGARTLRDEFWDVLERDDGTFDLREVP